MDTALPKQDQGDLGRAEWEYWGGWKGCVSMTWDQGEIKEGYMGVGAAESLEYHSAVLFLTTAFKWGVQSTHCKEGP